MEKLRDATLIFLVKKQDGVISDVCLALKKRSFGINKWNGVGGKVDISETIEGAAIRETKEEINVEVENLKKVAELSFHFPHNPDWSQTVHVYLCESWKGEPEESEEMKPGWFSVKDLPYNNMWSSDIFWLPKVLSNNLVKASITFAEGDVVLDQDVNLVESF